MNKTRLIRHNQNVVYLVPTNYKTYMTPISIGEPCVKLEKKPDISGYEMKGYNGIETRSLSDCSEENALLLLDDGLELL